jgi:hypothetical protein
MGWFIWISGQKILKKNLWGTEDGIIYIIKDLVACFCTFSEALWPNNKFAAIGGVIAHRLYTCPLVIF